MAAELENKPSNFIYDIIEDDKAQGTYDGRVVTRFPPEPNGYLHIGHAKSICLNFGIANHYDSVCHLRFDDTNPVKEDIEYVESIQNDVRWLGFDWQGKLFFASDYFEEMYQFAEKLIVKGLAYVDSQSVEEIRENRGSLTEAGTNSPYRERSVDENLELFRGMRAGKYEDGSHVLRAKIDMSTSNMLMRDPLLYRIKHADHHRTGSDWCIYPMYDYAHCLEDAQENITHSICTLEFENNRELYEWVLANVEHPNTPKQIEFARLALGYTMMSKRKLLQLVEEGVVSGWDDPRMPTLAGFRRRGVTPEAIRNFAEMVGVAKTNSLVDVEKLEFCIRDDLNQRVPRVMGVARPLKVVITNYPEDQEEVFDASLYPHDVPLEGSRELPFAREIYIDRDDFSLDPPKGWFRLAPGKEVRLRYAYCITCERVVQDDSGEVVELHCTYDPETRGGDVVGRKVRGTLHWVSTKHAVPVELRLYDRLFKVERPGIDPDRDFKEDLNPDSLMTLSQAMVEKSLATSEAGSRYQFERTGYFIHDADRGADGSMVFNRIISLRDSWAKQSKDAAPKATPVESKPKPSRKQSKPKARSKADERDRNRSADGQLMASFERYQSDLGLSRDLADRLTGDRGLSELFDAACSTGAKASSVAQWVVNEVLSISKDNPVSDLKLTGDALGALVKLVDEGTIAQNAGKDVLLELAQQGGDPSAIVETRGLRKESDSSALEPIVDQVLKAHPDEVARYAGGEKKLLGFFLGQVMRASKGSADANSVRVLLQKKLS
jgi:glutaminyl-tRNA synthetase